MKRITNSFIKNIVRQSLNESYGLLNEQGAAPLEKCPAGGFCVFDFKNKSASKADVVSKSLSSVNGDKDASVWPTTMESIVALCDNGGMGATISDGIITSIVDKITQQYSYNNVDEDVVKSQISLLKDFPSFCAANQDAINKGNPSLFTQTTVGPIDYKLIVYDPIVNLLNKSIKITDAYRITYNEELAKIKEKNDAELKKSGWKTKEEWEKAGWKPKPIEYTIDDNINTPNSVSFKGYECILEHPAKGDQIQIENGVGFKLKTGNLTIDKFVYGVKKNPVGKDLNDVGVQIDYNTGVVTDFNCDDRKIQFSYSQTTWDYDNVMDSSLWAKGGGGNRIALTTHPDLEDDNLINQSYQFETIKGFRHNLLTEVELKYNPKKPYLAGPDVVTIQKKLNISTVGGYGPETQRKVAAFQKENGTLPVTGDVDEATWTAITALPDPKVPSATEYTKDLTLKSTGPDVVAIQTKLGISTKGGYGPETQRKVAEFQKKYKLPETGVVDQTTFEKIIKTKGAGEPTTYSGKKHNYVVGNWIKVTPINGTITEDAVTDFVKNTSSKVVGKIKNFLKPGPKTIGGGGVVPPTITMATSLTDNQGIFKITDVPDEYTVIIDVSYTKSDEVVGGSTQKVLFGEQASEGSKTIIKKGQRNNTDDNTKGGGGNNGDDNTEKGNRNKLDGNKGTGTIDPEKQKQRDIRNKEFCDTLRQIKQYLNNTKSADLTVNCQRTPKTINQIMLALTGGTPVAPVEPVEVPTGTPGGNNVRIY